MNFAVVGSRSWKDESAIKDTLDLMIEPGDTIITGGASGVDKFAERYANKKKINLIIIRPDYEKHVAKLAPLIRNTEIISIADRVIAFWDGKSTGTNDVLKKARLNRIPATIILDQGTKSEGSA